MNLRKRFNLFCYKHRNWGIPSLMMFVSVGAAAVYLLSMINGGEAVYAALCFNKDLILQGQVWRLITYVFTYILGSNPFFVLISLVCYASLGRAIENTWGTFRFNLFYFGGILLTDIFAMIFCPSADSYLNALLAAYYIERMSYLLNLTLVISFATLYPDTRFMILFVIPVKAGILALVYIALNVVEVVQLLSFFPHCLLPVVGFLNYILFFGADIVNLLPISIRVRVRRLFRKQPKSEYRQPLQFRTGDYQTDHTTVQKPYTHRCTVCGRTDATHPDLEFRYCSRCSGYRCYCEDHIGNHEHITE